MVRKLTNNNKIRIGYVLKSADVGTLFSRRNSENSSHTPAHTCAHTCVHPRIPVHTRKHPGTPMHTRAYPPTPVHTHAQSRIPAHTHAHLHTPAHTHPHMHTPHTYPLMPANALNLINHMKLQVNIDDREIEKGRNKSPLRQSADQETQLFSFISFFLI